jgi:hypothetical protein
VPDAGSAIVRDGGADGCGAPAPGAIEGPRCAPAGGSRARLVCANGWHEQINLNTINNSGKQNLLAAVQTAATRFRLPGLFIVLKFSC